MLRELQQDMQRHLLGEASSVSAAIVDAPPLPAANRLAIYRNAYQVRLIDALHDTYPILHGLLGDEAWLALGEAYVAEHPSVFRSIRWYGGKLADFLARWHEVNAVVFAIVMRMGGSISAEHGVGVLKRDELPEVKDKVAIELMRGIKAMLDPHGIMNPGKVL